MDTAAELSPPSRSSDSDNRRCSRPVDLVHLARVTFGDRDLEHEVLQIFARQAGQLLTRMAEADSGTLAPLVHTLKGSARGIGAWRVAEAAEVLEQVSADAPDGQRNALARLAAAVDEAKAFIRDLLATP
jgi:HPt (histidine-containing phosphotransfer) domain-containing protein